LMVASMGGKWAAWRDSLTVGLMVDQMAARLAGEWVAMWERGVVAW